VCKKVQDVKSIKFIAQPDEKKRGMGNISYRLELNDFSNPIVDLPFGMYTSTAHKLKMTTAFSEVKSTFAYIKKNAGQEVSE
jgi:hypothetical protein